MRRVKETLVVGILIGVTGAIDYTASVYTSSFDIVYRELYLVPIVLSAYWFGKKGGLIASTSASLVYLPCAVLAAPAGSALYVRNIVEILLFNAVALLFGFLRDREKRREKEKLEAIMAMAGGVAHELNNPLAIALMNVEVVRNDVEPGSEHYQELQSVVENLKRMAAMIKKISQIERIELQPYAGKTKIVDFDRSSGGNRSPMQSTGHSLDQQNANQALV